MYIKDKELLIGLYIQIFVDSRFKGLGSYNNSNFTIELNDNVSLPPFTGACITDICIPRTWYGIDYNNNKLYFGIFLKQIV